MREHFTLEVARLGETESMGSVTRMGSVARIGTWQWEVDPYGKSDPNWQLAMESGPVWEV